MTLQTELPIVDQLSAPIVRRPTLTDDDRVELIGLPFEGLAERLEEWGVGRGQAKRVFRGLHVHRHRLTEINSLGRHAKTITEHLKHSAESSQAEIASVPVFWWAAFSGSAIVPN